MSPFLAWGDFHARSRFARSTIPEEKWGTTRSLGKRPPLVGRPRLLIIFAKTACFLLRVRDHLRQGLIPMIVVYVLRFWEYAIYFKRIVITKRMQVACVASVFNRVIARKWEREQLVPTCSTNSRGNACYAGLNVGDTGQRSKRFCSNAVLCASFTWQIVKNRRDQMTRGRRSKRAWSNCVLCIPFILSWSPNEW